MADPASHRERLLAGTRGLTEAIKHHGPDVILEPLSEPQLELARFLSELELPEDENVIVTVHHYWPITFTMQGEDWLGQTEFGDPATWLGTTWEGTARQRAELTTGFAGVAALARAHQRPVFVGAFGVSNNADMPSRVRWVRFNQRCGSRPSSAAPV